MEKKRIKLYSLSTCTYCQAIKKMLNDLEVAHEFVDGDLLEDREREALLNELRPLNPNAVLFPPLLSTGKPLSVSKSRRSKRLLGCALRPMTFTIC